VISPTHKLLHDST